MTLSSETDRALRALIQNVDALVDRLSCKSVDGSLITLIEVWSDAGRAVKKAAGAVEAGQPANPRDVLEAKIRAAELVEAAVDLDNQ